MIDHISIIISLLAFGISAATLWLTLLHRGQVRMTRPNVVFFGYDFVPKTTPKIFLRTLLYSTSEKGIVIESMYAKVENNGRAEKFSFWGYGETKNIVPGSGLYVGRSGVAVNHHFVLSVDKPVFEFQEGGYIIDIYARIVGRHKPRRLSRIHVDVNSEQADALSREDGLLFELQPESQTYTGHLREQPSN